ncbi:MAG: class I SAM-dependent methyltransferase [Paenibacillaceae bacterium]
MPDHNDIYQNETQQYELLIDREDYQHHIMKAIHRIVPNLEGLDVLDIGAGTGRLSCMLAPLVQSLIVTDTAEAMLDRATENLKRLGVANWQSYVADHRSLPITSQSVDLVTAGWTICYATNTHVELWEENLALIMKELERVLRPSGTVIIFENLGSGDEQPNPPDYLLSYYNALVTDYGFTHEYIRTDSQFKSVEEAERLFRFFFGDEFADCVRSSGQSIVPACTGIWWRTY